MTLPTATTNPAQIATVRPLRILVVDDNHINLSVLSRLLKRRFSHLVDGAPVTVDSGLKAIQLLRTNVFDCILMDIQMPFLSGLEATRRIRQAEDGILPANSNAHIVAVTTAIGDEPEIAYRRANMDGMIGKPVRYHHLQPYLCLLAREAAVASTSVSPLTIDGESVMPPLPPVSQGERVFYIPVGNEETSHSRPDICNDSDFEKLLEAQTRMSLRRRSAMNMPRTGSVSGATTRPLSARHDESREESLTVEEERLSSSSRSNSSLSLDKMEGSQSSVPSPPKMHARGLSMTISRRTLVEQIAREVTNAGLDGNASDALDSGVESDACTSNPPSSLNSQHRRPAIMHRISSPGWLLCDEEIHANKVQDYQQSKLPLPPSRPKLSLVSGVSDSDGVSSFDSLSSGDDSHGLFSPPLRRESQKSGTSTLSASSSTITTPNCDEEGPEPLWSPQSSFDFNKISTLNNDRCNSTTTVDPLNNGDDYRFPFTKDIWCVSSPVDDESTSSPDVLSRSPQGQSPKYRTLGRKRGVRLQDGSQALEQRLQQLDLTC